MTFFAKLATKLHQVMNRRLDVIMARQNGHSRDDVVESPRALASMRVREADELIKKGHEYEANVAFDDAMASYQKAEQLCPEYPPVALNLGNGYLNQDKYLDAVEQYRRAVRLKPDYSAAHFNLGNALDLLGRKSEAEHSYLEAIRYQPDFTDAYVGLANVLVDTGRSDAALINYRKALSLQPAYHNVRLNIALALRQRGEREAAIREYETILADDKEFLEAYGNLAVVYRELGMLNKAMDICLSFLEKKPDSDNIATMLLFCMSHSERVTASALFDMHRKFGLRMEQPYEKLWRRAERNIDLSRPLRVGFVSADLYMHSVVQFIEPVMDKLIADSDLDVFVYYNSNVADEINKELRKKYQRWRDVVSMSDDMFISQVENDQIDILIDLSGYTSGNRLSAFARRPAPVQVTWLGYPGTTGMKAMDYFFCDPYFISDNLETQFTEKFARLPITTTFDPVPYASPVKSLPCKELGLFTYGSFNRIEKLSPHVIQLWIQILMAVPQSRLILAGLPEKMDVSDFNKRFSEAGVDVSRIEYHHRTQMGKYLELHHRVDLCLDTFPYSGGTTTNHALWMGVPTLTLVGETAPGRQSYANMRHVGLGDDFYAYSADEFVAKAVALTEKTEMLMKVRSELRERFERSLFRRPDIVAKSMKHAFKHMWKHWVDGKSAEHFRVVWNDVDDSFEAVIDGEKIHES